LCFMAENHPADIWRFFGDRLNFEQGPEQQASYDYEPVPYQFHGLEERLSRGPHLGISTVRGWYRPDDHLFEFQGAQLLRAVFPSCPPAFAHGLSQLVEEGTDDDIGFVTAVLSRYPGEPATHSVLKAIVRKLPDSDQRLRRVEYCLENIGVVMGPFGSAEAYRTKKAEIASWCEDEEPKIKAFAAQFMAKLDLRIATEQRAAEERIELRKRDYGPDKPDSVGP
jgi:hypothetical protein